jgi:hypothetical protein
MGASGFGEGEGASGMFCLSFGFACQGRKPEVNQPRNPTVSASLGDAKENRKEFQPIGANVNRHVSKVGFELPGHGSLSHRINRVRNRAYSAIRALSRSPP